MIIFATIVCFIGLAGMIVIYRWTKDAEAERSAEFQYHLDAFASYVERQRKRFETLDTHVRSYSNSLQPDDLSALKNIVAIMQRFQSDLDKCQHYFENGDIDDAEEYLEGIYPEQRTGGRVSYYLNRELALADREFELHLQKLGLAVVRYSKNYKSLGISRRTRHSTIYNLKSIGVDMKRLEMESYEDNVAASWDDK
ncbi:MAG: hypothetical protein PHC51_11540 [bacterium]|nr:hypothetical protein [bacterium]